MSEHSVCILYFRPSDESGRTFCSCVFTKVTVSLYKPKNSHMKL